MDYVSVISGQLHAIHDRVTSSAKKGKNVHYSICRALNDARAEMIRALPSESANHVATFTNPVKSSQGDPPYPENADVALFTCDQLLAILEPLRGQSRMADPQSPPPINRIAPESRNVFIVHGHDETNLLRLRTLLKERYRLTPTILMEEASSGQTVIEKFERMASEAAFCIVLMTPDDQVSLPTGGVAQARPNAIFELGWFYGRLGRSRVCNLVKRGTSIHSDLAGIVSIEFIEKVDETVPALEKELRQAGLIS